VTKPRVSVGWWVVAGAFVRMLTGYAVAYSFAGAILAGAALCLVSFAITLFMPEPSPCQALGKAKS
jgi:hypothetical protein